MLVRRALRGGLVADGVGSVAVRADVLIEDDRIAAVEPDLGDVEAEIVDLEPGSVIYPGFIDAHVHAEGPLATHGHVPGALAQGVTTLVVGQDGSSWIGATQATADYLDRYYAPINGTAPAPLPRVRAYLEAVAGRLVQNVAVLASHGTIRHNIAGAADRPLDAEELTAARAQVERALGDGAVGLSSGFDYVPSTFGTTGELAALCAPMAADGLPYVSHLRSYGAAVADGLAELCEVGRRVGVPVHASHLWGDPAEIDAAVVDADRRGVVLTFDMYPYLRSSTILAMAVLPPELQAGGPDATLRGLRDPATRTALLARRQFGEAYLRHVVLGAVPDAWARYAGRTIVEAAGAAGASPGEWTLDLLIDADLQVGAHLGRAGLTEAALGRILRHPRHAAGSDGIYQGQHPHPRGYGAYARLANAYRDAAGRPDHQRIARHLATTAADLYHLAGRGRVIPGGFADLAVLAPAGMVERATDDRPDAAASGVTHVFVNGTLVWYADAPVPGRYPGVPAGWLSGRP